LFAGIGSQHKALKNIGVDFEVVGISEWSIDSNETTELSKEEILEELKHFTFSSNTKTPIKNGTLKLDRLKIYPIKGLKKVYLKVKHLLYYGK
jgi:site-specific DNA-cytosine methylase